MVLHLKLLPFARSKTGQVLEDLVYGTYLAKYDYRIIHEDSPDQRGIDVCLIYRADSLRLIDFRYWIPSGIEQRKFHYQECTLCQICIS